MMHTVSAIFTTDKCVLCVACYDQNEPSHSFEYAPYITSRLCDHTEHMTGGVALK